MAEDPEQLKRNIEQTRRNVGRDVDALTEKVSPSRVVGRRVDRARGGAHRLKERVMGPSESVSDAAGSAMSSVRDAGGQVGEAVTSVPDLARSRTRGTPLAAGVIAFAAGWVAAAVLPASTRERELAQETKDKAMEAAGPVKEMVHEVKDNLQEPAHEAVEQVRESASQAVTDVADEGRSAAQQVTQETKDSADKVRQAGSAS